MIDWFVQNKRMILDSGFIILLIILAITVAILYTQIQDSRTANCIAQNQRHHNTVLVLKQIISDAETGASKTQINEIKNSYQSTLLVINSLQPIQNCAQSVSN